MRGLAKTSPPCVGLRIGRRDRATQEQFVFVIACSRGVRKCRDGAVDKFRSAKDRDAWSRYSSPVSRGLVMTGTDTSHERRSFLNRMFGLTEHGTNVRTEF